MGGVIPLLVPCIAVAVVVYQVAICIYYLYFHKLSHIPGPRLYAVSKLPIIFKRISGNSVSYTNDLHIKYGPIVRLAPEEVSTIDPLAWKEIYGHRVNGRGNLPKDMKIYMRHPAGGTAQSMLSADDETHARLRKTFAHAFSDRALREQEVLLKHYTDLLVEKLGESLEQNGDGKVEMTRFYNFTTFDFIADCCFGESLHLLENMEYNPWVTTVFQSVKFIAIANLFRFYPVLLVIVKWFLPKSLEQRRKDHLAFCTKRVDQRLERGETDHPDFWTLVLKNEGTAKSLSLGEMHLASTLFMTAGTETTATLLSGLTYYLCMNPDKKDKLTREIRGAFATADEMTTVTLPQLKYLWMCLEEALRIYPPVAVGQPRLVTGDGIVMDGVHIPAGATVSLPHWTAYHTDTMWARPMEFIPERWDSPTPEEFKDDRRDVFNPFSNGPRNCLGKNLAYHEMRLMIAKVLWAYDMELAPGMEGWVKQKVFTLYEKPELWVKLTPVVREKQ